MQEGGGGRESSGFLSPTALTSVIPIAGCGHAPIECQVTANEKEETSAGKRPPATKTAPDGKGDHTDPPLANRPIAMNSEDTPTDSPVSTPTGATPASTNAAGDAVERRNKGKSDKNGEDGDAGEGENLWYAG